MYLFKGKQQESYTKKSRTKVTKRSVKNKGFLQCAEPDSESISQGDVKPIVAKLEPESNDKDEIEVGRKIPHRKRVAPTMRRSPYKKTLTKSRKPQGIKNEERHIVKGFDASLLETYVEAANGEDGKEEVNEHMVKEDSELDPKKLLEEIENQSAGDEDIGKVFDKKTNLKNLDKSPCKQVIAEEADMSILDDILFNSNQYEKRKKPPSAKVKRMENTDNDLDSAVFDRKKGRDRKDYGSVGSSADEAIHLNTSTLKDDIQDCFDNPRIQSARKRKAPPHRGKTNREEKMYTRNDKAVQKVSIYTLNSESDSDDMFSGKQKKKGSLAKASSSKRSNSVKSVNASLSLFD